MHSQTFVITKVNYLHLPRPQFKTLQKHVFPIYFRISAALAAVTAVTYPCGSIFALPSNRIDFALLSLTLAVSCLNLLVYGPKTIEAMVLRTHQGKITIPTTYFYIPERPQLIGNISQKAARALSQRQTKRASQKRCVWQNEDFRIIMR